MSAASWNVPPWTPPTRPRPAATLARNSSRVAPGAAVHVVPTRRSVCASLPPTTTLPRELALVEVKRMVEREEDAGLAQVGSHFEGVAAQRLQLPVRRLGHPPRAEV